MSPTDTIVASSGSDAATTFQTFSAEPNTSTSCAGTDRATVAARLELLVSDPTPLQQGSFGLCGPASFFYHWIKRDPVGFANFSTALYDNGTGQIGTLTVAPSQQLLGTDYTKVTDPRTPAADWFILGGLRNSTDGWWQPNFSGAKPAPYVIPFLNINIAATYADWQTVSAPYQVASWFTATGIYSNVDNQTNLVISKGTPHALGLNLIQGTDIVLLIDANLINAGTSGKIDNGLLGSNKYFPDHWVVLLSPVTQAPPADSTGTVARGGSGATQPGSDSGTGSVNTAAPSAGNIILTVWSWGSVYNLSVPAQEFANYYFGAIIATLKTT